MTVLPSVEVKSILCDVRFVLVDLCVVDAQLVENARQNVFHKGGTARGHVRPHKD